MDLEMRIANTKNEFEDILRYVLQSKEQSLANIEKTIFRRLMKIGLGLLMIFISKFTQNYEKLCVDQPGNTLNFRVV